MKWCYRLRLVIVSNKSINVSILINLCRKHKLKRLVQHPNSYFMDVKCPGCYRITTVFSHAQTVVVCAGCSTVLCQPTGGRAR